MNSQTVFAATSGAALLVATVFASTTPLSAGILIDDDFESYPNTVALNDVWPKAASIGSDAVTFMDIGPAGSTNTSRMIHHTSRNARRDRSFMPTVATAMRPLVVEYDLYDATAASDPGAYDYNQVLAFNGATLTQLISIGKTNLATTNGPNNVNKYQGRVAFPPPAEGGANWINLNTNRSVGWHTFKVEIFATTVNFYVDGVLDTAGVPRAGGSDPFSVARIGSGAGARTQEAFYDNFRVLSPDPGDINLDGAVNRLDASLFARHLGTPSGALWTTGDFDGDRATTLADLALLQAHLVQIGDLVASASPVPEPSTFMLAACGFAAIAIQRRRRARWRSTKRLAHLERATIPAVWTTSGM